MNRYWIYFSLIIFISCQGSSTGPKYDLKGYNTENIGGGAQLVTYQDDNLYFLANGAVINGVRNGSWVTYHPNTNKIKTLTTYVNGEKNGVEITMNDRGQIESMIGYKNNILHGVKANYQFGRPTDETTYKDGKINGPFAVYNGQAQLQKKGFFKNGKQDGKLTFFDEKGNVTLEYEYKDGEKISGGIVEKPATEE
jgi:antitoxin component YwqK of YwqJK toxin-antitoxin module